MKKNKTVILILVLLILLSVLTAVASQRTDFLSWRKSVDDIKNSKNNESIVMKVNDEIITKKDFELLKLALSQAEMNCDDNKIKNELIRRAVIDSEVTKRGVTASDEEVFAFNEERFSLIFQDKENTAIMEDFLKNNNISLEEYKKQSLEISRKALLAIRLREELIEDYKNSDKYKELTGNSSINQNNFFEEYIREKIDEANIEIFN